MHVTYKPEDGDQQEWDFTAGRVRSGEAGLMQERFGGTWEQFDVALQKGDIIARRVLLWHLLRLEHAKLRWEDTPDFFAEELIVEFSVKELTQMIEDIQQARGIAEGQREQILAAFATELEKAAAREGVGPKAASPASLTSETVTG